VGREGGGFGVDADGFSYDKKLSVLLSMYNYFLLLNSQEQTVGTAQVSIVCWNGTRFRYVKVHIP